MPLTLGCYFQCWKCRKCLEPTLMFLLVRWSSYQKVKACRVGLEMYWVWKSQHVLISLLSTRYSKSTCSYPQSLVLLNDIQCAYLKDPLLDTELSLLNLTKYFNLFDTEAIPGYRLLDSFPDHISFHPCNFSSLNNCTAYLKSLDCLCLEVASSFSTLVVVTNASVILSRYYIPSPTIPKTVLYSSNIF